LDFTFIYIYNSPLSPHSLTFWVIFKAFVLKIVLFNIKNRIKTANQTVGRLLKIWTRIYTNITLLRYWS